MRVANAILVCGCIPQDVVESKYLEEDILSAFGCDTAVHQDVKAIWAAQMVIANCFMYIPSCFNRTHSCSLLDVQFLEWKSEVLYVCVFG